MLVPAVLANDLASDWLTADDGPHAQSVQASADRFSQIVAGWFAGSQAAAFPNTTAMARQQQLMAQAVPALSAESAMAAGPQLATALMGYMAGQVYGPGAAAPPLATVLAGMAIGAAFANVDLDNSSRAQQIAAAIHMMAISCVVAFPNPPFAAPVM